MMDEYGVVIEEFKRMCWYYSRDKTQKTCPMCASYPNCNIGQCRKIAFERPREFEGKVMLWARENPEPVYPTWIEWLYTVVPRLNNGNTNSALAIYALEQEHIPADIAQKLGIEPKEG